MLLKQNSNDNNNNNNSGKRNSLRRSGRNKNNNKSYSDIGGMCMICFDEEYEHDCVVCRFCSEKACRSCIEDHLESHDDCPSCQSNCNIDDFKPLIEWLNDPNRNNNSNNNNSNNNKKKNKNKSKNNNNNNNNSDSDFDFDIDIESNGKSKSKSISNKSNKFSIYFFISCK